MNILAEFQSIRKRLLEEFPELRDDLEALTDIADGEMEFSPRDWVAKILRKRQETKASVDGLGAYIETLKERKDNMARRVERLASEAERLMEAASIRKIEAEDFTAYFALSKPSVIVTNETLIPEQYFRVKREPNKVEIAKALEGGEKIPGATFSNRAETLRIKVR